MAEKRMFSKAITESDNFTLLSLPAQALYFHICMSADDDGFCNTPRSIMRLIGADQAALDELINERFLLSFDPGLVVVKHWRINNTIRKDRYTKTTYAKERKRLKISPNGAYTLSKATVQNSVQNYVENYVQNSENSDENAEKTQKNEQKKTVKKTVQKSQLCPNCDRDQETLKSANDSCPTDQAVSDFGCQVVAKVTPQNRIDKDDILHYTSLTLGKCNILSGKPDDTLHKTRKKRKSNTDEENLQKAANYIIALLNEQAGTKFKPNAKDSSAIIKAKLVEYSVDDLAYVVQIKCAQWKHDPLLKKYLRPQTLFGKNFEAYLNEK